LRATSIAEVGLRAPASQTEVGIIGDSQRILDTTHRWIASVVIGLNLCPFARRVFEAGLIRSVVSEATDAESLRSDLARELDALRAAPIDVIETTFLIHPGALARFDDYCDFLEEGQRLLKSRGLLGVIQIASFHPEFRFADATPDDVGNWTNRSPYPMLHLLREESVDRVAADPDELLEIPRRNAALLRKMGPAAILKLVRDCSCEEASDAVQ
jgi:hypothetical protein